MDSGVWHFALLAVSKCFGLMKTCIVFFIGFVISMFIIMHAGTFLANVNVYVTFAICHRRSVCRLSVCDVGAPYSGG